MDLAVTRPTAVTDVAMAFAATRRLKVAPGGCPPFRKLAAPVDVAMAPPLLWFLSAAVLLLLALLGADNDGLLLVAGLCGLLLTLVAIALPLLPPLAQVLLFVTLVVVGYGLLRHWARQQRERSVPLSAAAETAEVISGFDADGHGRVRWQGQSWAALNLAPDVPLLPGRAVTVMGREGTRLQVLPRQSTVLEPQQDGGGAPGGR